MGRASARVSPLHENRVAAPSAVTLGDVAEYGGAKDLKARPSSAEPQRRWNVIRSVVLPGADPVTGTAGFPPGFTQPGAGDVTTMDPSSFPGGDAGDPGSGTPLRALLLNWRSAQRAYIRKRLRGEWFRYDVERKQARYVVDPRGRGHRWWDMFIILCVLWNAILVPYDAAFSPPVPTSRSVIDTVVDCLFGCDLCLSLITGRVDKHGRLQTDARANITHYARTWLSLDLLGTLPLEIIVRAARAQSGAADSHKKLQLLSLLKTMRLLRLSKLLRAFDNMRGAGLLRLVRLVLLWALVAHWVACAYYLLGISQNGGMGATSPNANWLVASLQAIGANVTAGSQPRVTLMDAYSLALSASVVCLVGNGLPNVTTTPERLFNAVVTMMGALLQAIVIGNCAQVVAAMGAASVRHQSRADAALDTARYLNLPRPLVQRVADYFNFVGSSAHPGPEGFAQMEALSPPLHRDVVVHLYGDALRAVPLLRGLPPSFIAAVAARVQSRIYMRDEVVFRAGELSREMFFIVHGTVEVLDGVKNTRMSLLEDGAYFGELALIANVLRSSTVQTLTPAEICSLSGAALAAVLDDFPDVEPLLRDRAAKRITTMTAHRAAPGGGGVQSVFSPTDQHSTLRGLAPLLADLAATSAETCASPKDAPATAVDAGSQGSTPRPTTDSGRPTVQLASSLFKGARRRSLVSVALSSDCNVQSGISK